MDEISSMSRSGGMLADDYLQIKDGFAAAHTDSHFVPRLALLNKILQILEILNGVFAEAEDHIVRFEAGLFGRRILGDLGDAARAGIAVGHHADIRIRILAA